MSSGLKRSSSSLSQTVRDAETKKVKTEGDSSAETSAPTPDDEDIGEIVSPVPESNVSMGEAIVMGEHGEEKLTETGGAFNESPYTYLASGNRHAKACLCVSVSGSFSDP